MSLCVMCANPVGASKIVGIGREDVYTNTGKMVAHPVCTKCHTDPDHRMLKVKVHFISVHLAQAAVEAARMVDKLSREGKDISL